MVRLTIRKKVFFGFIAALLIPIALILILAILYLNQMREWFRVDLQNEINRTVESVDIMVRDRISRKNKLIYTLARSKKLKSRDEEQIRRYLIDMISKHRTLTGAIVYFPGQPVIVVQPKSAELPRQEAVFKQLKILFEQPTPSKISQRYLSLDKNGYSSRKMNVFRPIFDENEKILIGVIALYLDFQRIFIEHPEVFKTRPKFKKGEMYFVAETLFRSHAKPLPDPKELFLGGQPVPIHPVTDLIAIAEENNPLTLRMVPGKGQAFIKVSKPVRGAFRIVSIAPVSTVFRPLELRQNIIIAGIAVSLGLAFLIAWILARSFVRPLSRLERSVQTVSKADYQQLLSIDSTDEIGDLVFSIKTMLESLFHERQREEILAWKKLIRILSHEINNSIAPIQSIVTTVQTSYIKAIPDPLVHKDVSEALDVVISRVNQLKSFLSRYTEIAKLKEPNKSRVDVLAFLKKTIALFKKGYPSDKLDIIEEYDAALGFMDLDPEQIELVLVNLLKNALEAVLARFEDKGEGDSQFEKVERGRIIVRAYVEEATAILAIGDNGLGMSDSALKSVFTPFFTTKKGGSGIGLTLSREIILNHGGEIQVSSEPGVNTTVSIKLPLPV